MLSLQRLNSCDSYCCKPGTRVVESDRACGAVLRNRQIEEERNEEKLARSASSNENKGKINMILLIKGNKQLFTKQGHI